VFWYQYFDKVSAEDIRSNLQAATALRPNLPLDVIQIDDGFESTVGDWFSFSPSFRMALLRWRARSELPGLPPVCGWRLSLSTHLLS
jgi:hypothetical protein